MTHLPLQHDKFVLKLLDLVLLQSNPQFSLLLSILQGSKMMEHLPKVLLLILPLLVEKTLFLPTTDHTVVQHHHVCVDLIKDQSDLLLPIVDIPLQVVTLIKLVRGALKQVTLQVYLGLQIQDLR